ncbi:hypothetical protein CANARDRAFT_148778 [[Candida] arabinofermentans NRRL YB-2248]|uniref:GDP-mannose transporter n=1 Tax=[Candida] arabinofermentans NRRL YB-2248 TaxID=983967 RepID=A0A1E4T2L4_9ASCO|nr:hypothetical protein CANARDRAFT_148778 [[Candida] arabinofermentans NRRL YB-2248]
MAPQIPRSYAELKEKVPNIGIVFTAILSWFTFSLLISLYNKWMFSDETLDFKFPVLITACHQLILFILSCVTLIIWPKFRLNYHEGNSTTNNNTESISYLINPKTYLTKILPCALASASDIGLGNSSLKFITISLYTMLKSSAVLIFTLFWGFLLRLEKITTKLIIITIIMTLSVMMMVYGQNDDTSDLHEPESVEEEIGELKKFTKFLIKRTVDSLLTTNELGEVTGEVTSDDTGIFSEDAYEEAVASTTASTSTDIIIDKSSTYILFIGCFLVLLASCMSGLRWALTQIVLRGNRYTKNPILTIFYLSPAMFISLVLMGSQVEGFDRFLNSKIWSTYGVFGTFMLLLFPGCLAFCMTLSQFIILQYAPLLTLSIAGIVREVITIFLGWLIFGDKLNFVNLIGIVITLCDITWYNLYRLELSNQKNDVPKAIVKEDRERLIDESGNGVDNIDVVDVVEMDRLNSRN